VSTAECLKRLDLILFYDSVIPARNAGIQDITLAIKFKKVFKKFTKQKKKQKKSRGG